MEPKYLFMGRCLQRMSFASAQKASEKAEEYFFEQAKRKDLQIWRPTRALLEDYKLSFDNLEWRFRELKEDFRRYKRFHMASWIVVLAIQVCILILQLIRILG